MVATPHELIAQVSDLVSLPDIYLRVKGVIEDPESGMSDLVTVVAHDPSLTARLLKLANSAFFGFTTKIDTIDRAVNLLGAQQIHNLVLATTVADAFQKVTPNTISMDEFWSSSIHCGLLAQSLAKACGLVEFERFFVEGLLYDIGHLVLDQTLPEACASAYA
jgi:HD-like signal output (HDOD) protein